VEKFLKAIEECVANRNWYGALFIALTLPDICGKIEFTGRSSTNRYTDWFEKYLGPRYTRQIGGAAGCVHKFLSGSDCYALRCVLLHEGTDEIGGQRAQELLEKFHFTEPPASGVIHLNQKGTTLQLQVDEFSKDVVISIRSWLADVSKDEKKQAELSKLMKVHSSFRF